MAAACGLAAATLIPDRHSPLVGFPLVGFGTSVSLWPGRTIQAMMRRADDTRTAVTGVGRVRFVAPAMPPNDLLARR
ncbi:hypothetical protein [Micromonospora pallida]|uniref:hypothetical protein n=1 Tax=Micromonospora pallida TaxID=145854 RepID=UPI00159F2D06|nr:hypothetical protein [Micromonospora pallida]